MKKQAKKKVSSGAAKKTSKKRPAEPPRRPSPSKRKPKADASDEVGFCGAERSFLETIAADADDDAPRLVYADWLEERGDPRAEFIRVQCELAPLGRYEDRSIELRRRQDELWETHKNEWSGPLRKLVGRIEFRRGVLEHVSAKVARFLENADKIFEVPTVRSAKLNTLKPVLDEFVKCSHCTRIGPRGIRALLSSPHLVSLKELDLSGIRLDVARVQAIAEVGSPRALRRFILRSVDMDGAKILAASDSLRQLDRLEFVWEIDKAVVQVLKKRLGRRVRNGE